MAILELNQVYYQYKDKHKSVDAVNNISISFEVGKVYAIVGPSGSGKTTLLSLIAGLDKPTRGDVFYRGQNLDELDKDLYRQKSISFIYQSYNLLPLLTVLENVVYPMELNKVGLKQANKEATEILISLGIDKDYHSRFPSTLSGGEQQRVAIARALASHSNILLADEPTGNLDSENSGNIVRILVDLSREKNYCIIIVTHDLEVAQKADIIINMRDGEILRY